MGDRDYTEKEYLYWMFQIPGMGAAAMKKLWEEYKSYKKIYYMEGTELVQKGLIRARCGKSFDEWKIKLAQSVEEYHSLKEKGIRFISILDREYPKRLRQIHGNPAGIYVKGKLPREEEPSAAIIGARQCSHYGKEVAEYLGSSLSGEGIQIISGLAAGIDGASHRGALREGKDTYGILGCGINICYPRENYPLYREMEKRGGIISERPLNEEPLARNFPMRNRIISGMADVIIVVEAKEKSGSLITVELGLEQGKEIYAVPGAITDSLSKGCNQLIKAGAGILTSADDIMEYFQIKNDKKLRVHEKNPILLAKKEKMLYSCLDLRPKFIEQIVSESGLPMRECMTLLLELELKGYIAQTANHYYAKKI